MGQIFLARQVLQKATVNSPLGGRLRPCIGFRVNPAANTSSAALAHDSRHCSHSAHSHLLGCCGTQGRSGGNETGAGTELLATPQAGNLRLLSVLKIFLNCLFQSMLFGFVFFSQEQVGIHLPSGKMQYYKLFRCCPHYRKDGHLRNKSIDLS